MPSIAEIARYADVSRCAASQILNKSKGHQRFSQEVCERVETMATQLGWVRDSRGLALQQGKTGVLALALHWSDRANGLQRALISAVETAVSARDLHLQIISSASEALQAVHSNRCDGVLINAWGFSDADILLFQQVDHAVLCRVPQGMRGVEFDVSTGLLRAVTHLHSLGHREVLWLAGDTNGDQDDRFRIIHDAAKQLGVKAKSLLVPLPKPISNEADEIAILQEAIGKQRQVLEQHRAIICYNEMVAIALYAALAGRVRIPDELSVVSIDDIYAPICVPPLTSVAFNFDRLAEKAVEQLLAKKSKDLIKDPTDLSIRSSTALRIMVD